MNFNPPNDNQPAPWGRWFSSVGKLLNQITMSGTTANRPTVGLYVGRPYFDTTLGKPLFYDGSQWVDATGAAA